MGNAIITIIAIGMNLYMFAWLIWKVARHLQRNRLSTAGIRVTTAWWIATMSVCGLLGFTQHVPDFPTVGYMVLFPMLLFTESMGIGHLIVLFDPALSPTERRGVVG